MKKNGRQTLLNSLALACLLALSLMIMPLAFCGDFDLSEMDPVEIVDLPGTNMKGGQFVYEFNEKKYDNGYKDRTRKAGVLVDNKVLYYVHTGTEEFSYLDPGGDCNFGVHKNYFMMDCFSYGAAHNRMMYLFKTGRDKVELLDILKEASVAPKGPLMDFMSIHTEADKPGFYRSDYRYPLWMVIKDVDGDGYPEIRLWIDIFDTYSFDLYVELKDEKLHVDLNPALYRPLFKAEKKRKKRTDAYYFYGVLSGALRLENITAELKRKDKEYIKVLLEKRDTWDDAFHKKKIPPLVKYEIRK